MFRFIFLITTFLLLTACTSVGVNRYADDKIQFNPQQFFNNQLVAEGFVRDRKGNVTRYFTADIMATWNDNSGTLDEVFIWSDGERQTRVWQFSKTTDNQYLGTAGDVLGNATMDYAGNAIRMTYQLDVPLKSGKTIAIDMDDWLFQVSDNSLVNVTKMTKWGFHVGEVVLTMRIVD